MKLFENLSNLELKEQENRVHALTFIIIECDEQGDISYDGAFPDDFMRAMEALAELQQNEELSEQTVEELNSLFEMWSDRFFNEFDLEHRVSEASDDVQPLLQNSDE